MGLVKELGDVASVLARVPAWLTYGLAVGITAILIVPFTADIHLWVLTSAVLLDSIALVRAIYELSAYIKRRNTAPFVLTPILPHCHFGDAVQKDGSTVTWVYADLHVKNTGAEEIQLVRVELQKPRIRGPVLSRSVSLIEYGGDCVIPPGWTLPIRATIGVRGRTAIHNEFVPVALQLYDSDGHDTKINFLARNRSQSALQAGAERT